MKARGIQKPNACNRYDSGVLIDDNSLYATHWNQAGKPFNKMVQHYYDGVSFINDSSKFSRNTFIYMDWVIPPHVDGLWLIDELVKLKFENIFITTNWFELTVPQYSWIPIISKDPPWALVAS